MYPIIPFFLLQKANVERVEYSTVGGFFGSEMWKSPNVEVIFQTSSIFLVFGVFGPR